MQIFVLWSGYEDIEGVFSSLEKAEQHRFIHMTAHKHKRLEDYSVIEMTLDEPDVDD